MESDQDNQNTKPDTTARRNLLSGARYLREISVVVIGVAITFLVSAAINNHQEKKQLRGYLKAVKMEMKYNLDLLEENQPFYDQIDIFADYLASGKREELDRDSVEFYATYRGQNNIVNDFFTLAVETSAFEMLKSSGAMNNMKDLDFLQAILRCYNLLLVQKKDSDEYMARKLDVLYRVVLSNELLFSEFDLLDPRLGELFYFFATSHYLHRTNKRQIEMLRETLEIFSRHKIH